MKENSNALYSSYQDWKSWETMFVYTADYAGYFATELADLKIRGGDVLEIGFGSGTCVSWMADHCATVSVTEISERSVDAARAKGYAVLPVDLPQAASDYRGAFDTIIAFDVFEHLGLEDVDRYLDACSTMLREGGRLLLRFPNSQSPFGLMHQAGDPTHKSQMCLAVLQLMTATKPLTVRRYGGSFMYRGKSLTLVWVKRCLRRGMQRVLHSLLRFTYGTMIPYEPVAVIVFEKTDVA